MPTRIASVFFSSASAGGALLLSAMWGIAAFSQDTVKANGSTTVAPVVAAASEALKARGVRVTVDTHGGSSGGLTSVSLGLADVGLLSRPLTDADRKKHATVELRESVIGFDGLAIVVSKPVFEGGVTSLSRSQIQRIYEGKVKNWVELGGPDSRIVFFNKEPGRGSWEVFAQFVYGKAEKAPKVFHPEVGANLEALTKVSQHRSAISQLSASWAANASGVRAVGIRLDDGMVSFPSRVEVETGRYPMRRPLVLVTRGAPSGDIAKLIAFFDTKEGRSLLEKAGFLALEGSQAQVNRE